MPGWNTYTVNAEIDIAKDRQQMATTSHELKQPTFPGSSSASPSTAERASSKRSYLSGEKMAKRKDHLVLGSPVSSSTSRSREILNNGTDSVAICGWVVASILGILAITFLCVIYFVPIKGVFPVMVQMYQPPDVPNHQAGHLQVYPGVNTSTFSYVISLDPADITRNSLEIAEVVQGYPTHDANHLPPTPYLHCWFNNPSYEQPCFFDKGWLGNHCHKEDGYGYNNTNDTINPCFVVRIEGTQDWFPEQLRAEFVSDKIRKEHDPSFLGLACAAKENDKSGVTFMRSPIKGFSLHFFPVTAFDPVHYLAPAVMVQVQGVPRMGNVSIHCWLRTHNKYKLTDSGHINIDFVHRKVATNLYNVVKTARRYEPAPESSSALPEEPATNSSSAETVATEPEDVNGGMIVS